jgi:hypothetical protein
MIGDVYLMNQDLSVGKIIEKKTSRDTDLAAVTVC